MWVPCVCVWGNGSKLFMGLFSCFSVGIRVVLLSGLAFFYLFGSLLSGCFSIFFPLPGGSLTNGAGGFECIFGLVPAELFG